MKYIEPIEESRNKIISFEFVDEPEGYNQIGDEKASDKEALYFQLNGIKKPER